jgi:hypothetical protein
MAFRLSLALEKPFIRESHPPRRMFQGWGSPLHTGDAACTYQNALPKAALQIP